MVAMPIPDQLRALDAAQKFVRTQMTPADLMAIMMFDNGAVQVLQDFTDDRERILSIVETVAVGEDENATAADDSSADTGAAFGQNDAEFNIFFTDRELSALQTAATMLGKLNEKKSLIYFASGLRLNGVQQSGATARDHQRGHSGRRLLLVDRRARSHGGSRPWATPARVRPAVRRCIPARRPWRR